MPLPAPTICSLKLVDDLVAERQNGIASTFYRREIMWGVFHGAAIEHPVAKAAGRTCRRKEMAVAVHPAARL
jgi:hypothetical protein